MMNKKVVLINEHKRVIFRTDDKWFQKKWIEGARIVVVAPNVICGYDLSKFDSFEIEEVEK